MGRLGCEDKKIILELVQIIYAGFFKQADSNHGSRKIQSSAWNSNRHGSVSMPAIHRNHQKYFLSKQLMQKKSCTILNPAQFKMLANTLFEPEAVLGQLRCEVHPPLSLVSTSDQMAFRALQWWGGGFQDIQPTCHMCTLYLAQMAFGALQWRGVLDIQPTRHIHV